MLELRDGIAVCAARKCRLADLPTVVRRLDVVPPKFEMRRKIGRDLVDLLAIGLGHASGHGAMKTDSGSGWHAVVDHFAIQMVSESIRAGDCPVRPRRDSVAGKKTCHVNQGRTLRLRILDRRAQCGGDRRGRKGLASHTRDT